MKTEYIQGLAIVVMVAAFPLLVWGPSADMIGATIAGAVVVSIATAALTALRYLSTSKE